MTTPTVITAPGVVPVVQIGVSDELLAAPGGMWDVTEWDDPALSVWSGLEPLWRDVTCDSIRVESFEGRDRALARWQVGTCTVEAVNPDGWADILATPPVSSALQLRPGRQLRWGVSIDGAEPVWLWRGYIDTHAADYEGQSALTDVVRFDCVDALGEVGRARIAFETAPAETASERITRILDAVPWPAAKRAVDDSYVPIFAADLDEQILDLLTATADSAGGHIYGNRDGWIVFRGRHWQIWDVDDPPVGAIGNAGTGVGVVDVVEGADDVVFGVDDVIFGVAAGFAAVCPVRFEVEFTRAGATNRGLVNYQGADTQPRQFDDLVSQAKYGVETEPERLDLQTSSPAALDWLAERLVATQGADTQPRITAVIFDAGTSQAARDLMATIDPAGPTRWRCRLDRAGRTVFDRYMFVTGVQHSLDAETWTCRVALDDATPWIASGGMWDAALWDAGVWAELGTAMTTLLSTLKALEAA